MDLNTFGPPSWVASCPFWKMREDGGTRVLTNRCSGQSPPTSGSAVCQRAPLGESWTPLRLDQCEMVSTEWFRHIQLSGTFQLKPSYSRGQITTGVLGPVHAGFLQRTLFHRAPSPPVWLPHRQVSLTSPLQLHLCLSSWRTHECK
jgi:hypothetical protein